MLHPTPALKKMVRTAALPRRAATPRCHASGADRFRGAAPAAAQAQAKEKAAPIDPNAIFVGNCDPSKLLFIPFHLTNRRHRGAY